MVKIYGFSTFNPLKVVITAEELGLDYDYEAVDLGARKNLEPQHLARHPFGKVPVLEVDGEYICESAAICRYLAAANKDRLYSSDPLQAAQIDQIVDMLSLHIGRWLSVYFWEETIKPRYFDQEADPKKIAEAAGWLEKQLPYLERLLEDGKFLCGDEISIADTFAYSYLAISENTSVSLEPYPRLRAWYQAMAERPAVRRAVARVFGD